MTATMTATKLTPTPTRTVWAIDVLASTVSLAKIEEPADLSRAPRPRIGKVSVEVRGAGHTPRTQWRRASAAADRVFDKITADGKPTLVVLSKQQWQAMSSPGKTASDPTAQRRMALQALIEDRLHAAGIPTAEFPYPTALVWLNGFKQHRGSSMTALAQAVETTFGITAPHGESFRPQVAALAAVGAMAVGIETAVEVTDARLQLARGDDNRSVQFPSTRKCPDDLEGWNALHRNPTRLET